jgi:hypothetical protein
VHKPETKELESYDDSDWVDQEEEVQPQPTTQRKGGAKTLDLLYKVSRIGIQKSRGDGKLRVRCLASAACGTSWVHPRSRKRIVNHSMGCKWLPDEYRTEITKWRRSAVVKKRRKAGGRAKTPELSSSDDAETGDEGDGSRAAAESEEDGRGPSKRARLTSAPSLAKGGIEVFAAFQTEGTKQLKEDANLALTHVVACNPVAPNLVDTDEFKKFCYVLNPKYKLPCGSTVRSVLIPDHALEIRGAIVDYLSHRPNNTLSFDGAKFGKRPGYTICVATAKRRRFLLDLDDASLLSHTAVYIFQVVLRPVRDIARSSCA